MNDVKIEVSYSSEITFKMIISVPNDKDEEEYIDVLLFTIFKNFDFDWDFA